MRSLKEVDVQASLRRKIILQEMDSLNQKMINCHNCPGHCCTAVANSMQTTPLETLDVLNYLRENQLWTEKLRQKLAETVQKFRLDVIPGNGRKNFLRKTYDCPFFEQKALGCTLPRDIKPYGCLGFNPSEPNESEGKSCSSDQKLLLKREEANQDEITTNQELSNKYKLWWQKLPLPLALLEAEKSGM